MFTGFTEETSQFLWELAFNNERSWFEAHREQFQRCLMEPFKALARNTMELMQKRWPDMELQLHISRIYRDARRLYGRGPYKDHLWFSIKNWEGLLCGPMFWFEIGAADFSYGMGFYSATAQQMEQYRKSIEVNPTKFETLVKAINDQKIFTLVGDEYKRPKGDMGQLLNPWYNRKHIALEFSDDFGGIILTPELPQILTEHLSMLMPLYDYFMQVCSPNEFK